VWGRGTKEKFTLWQRNGWEREEHALSTIEYGWKEEKKATKRVAELAREYP